MNDSYTVSERDMTRRFTLQYKEENSIGSFRDVYSRPIVEWIDRNGLIFAHVQGAYPYQPDDRYRPNFYVILLGFESQEAWHRMSDNLTWSLFVSALPLNPKPVRYEFTRADRYKPGFGVNVYVNLAMEFESSESLKDFERQMSRARVWSFLHSLLQWQ